MQLIYSFLYPYDQIQHNIPEKKKINRQIVVLHFCKKLTAKLKKKKLSDV